MSNLSNGSVNLINTYFDRIFVINLKKRSDRKEQMIKKLEKSDNPQEDLKKL